MNEEWEILRFAQNDRFVRFVLFVGRGLAPAASGSRVPMTDRREILRFAQNDTYLPICHSEECNDEESPA